MRPLLLAAALSFVPAALMAAEAKVGEPAPDFAVADTHGAERTLSEFKGKTVVLEWHNKDCPYVKKHYGSGNIPGLQQKYTAQKVVWLTVISSAKGKQGHVTAEQADADMLKADAKPTAVLLDADGKMGKAYGAKVTPHMYVIDGKGVLRYNGAIDSIPSADAEDIAAAEPYAALAIDAVLAGKPVKDRVTKPYGCGVKYKN